MEDILQKSLNEVAATLLTLLTTVLIPYGLVLLRSWVKALGEIVSARPPAERAKLWADNAKRIYRLG